MEFLLSLTADSQEIIKLIKQAEFKFVENAGICYTRKELTGAVIGRKRLVIICTENIKEREKNFSLIVNETIIHEAVHVAQFCNNGKAFMIPERSMRLSPAKTYSLQSSQEISGDSRKEHEAYWMETRPRRVKRSLRKYCL